MYEVVPRSTHSPVPLHGDWATRRIVRDVTRAVHNEHGRGIVAAAQVNAAAHVARTALINTALLSREEDELSRIAPQGEFRYKSIVDAYALVAARILGGL